jgi:hypothetical protein
MTEKDFDTMMARLKLQSAEFDTLAKLARTFNSLPAVVDDDYPEGRFNYENDLEDFIRALQANGRFKAGSRMGRLFPKTICLCGSTRFYEAFQKANYDLTMQGHIVLSVGFYRPSVESEAERQRYEHHGESIGCTPAQKEALDVLHKQKIELADEILVLNVNGYIGDSTRSEIEHAKKTNKPVNYLVPYEIK